MNLKVNYGQSVHGKEEICAVTEVLKNSTQMGRNTRKFEKKISTLFAKKYGLMVNSGTSALLLAYQTLPLPQGSNIITPVLTFATTVSTMVKSGFIPNFVDIKDRTFCIDEGKIEKAINNRTKAIAIPNLIGNLPNWKKIRLIARKHKLIIIEDSADALGSTIGSLSVNDEFCRSIILF